MKHNTTKQDLEDYPASALWYLLLASVSFAAATCAIAVAWGHSISHAILHV